MCNLSYQSQDIENALKSEKEAAYGTVLRYFLGACQYPWEGEITYISFCGQLIFLNYPSSDACMPVALIRCMHVNPLVLSVHEMI